MANIPPFMLSSTDFSLMEHGEKVGFLLSMIMPIAMLMVGFFALGLLLARIRQSELIEIRANEQEMLKEENDNLRSRLEKKEALYFDLSNRYDTLVSKLDRREKHVVELHKRLAVTASRREGTVQVVRTTERADVSELKQQLVRANQREDSLQVLVGQKQMEAERLRYEVEVLQAQVDQREEEKSADEFYKIITAKDKELADLKFEFQKHKKKTGAQIIKLAKQFAELSKRSTLSALDLPEPEEAHEPDEEGTVFDEVFDGETVERDHKYGVVYTRIPNKTDDLKKIKGVGKVVERKLNQAGIYRFKQIALWTDPIADQFASELPFGTRLVELNWIEQARELHERIYGEEIVS